MVKRHILIALGDAGGHRLVAAVRVRPRIG